MEHLIQHFRKDEQPFIEQVVGWQREVEDRYAPKLSDFLDPRQRFIVQSIIGQMQDLVLYSSGNFEGAERKRVMIAPSYLDSSSADFQITIFQIQYPTKFVQLKHPDVLGALLSLGIERSKFGDIRAEENVFQFAVASEVADYVRANLTSVGKMKVCVEEVSDELQLLSVQEQWHESIVLVSSMRLDVVLATVCQIARQKAQSLVAGNRVKVNWTYRDQTSFELQEGDILSVRGYGRFKVIATEGRTKKDKIRLQIGRLEQNS